MQIVILGMHRSGTSLTARLVNMMGAYFAPEGLSLGASGDNPKGFWERRDVLAINDGLLSALNCSWFDLRSWQSKRLKELPAPDIRALVLEMDAHRPWFIKDPRLCLLLPAWWPHLEMPVAVIVYRNPMEIAASLLKRNDFPVPFSLALWEHYAVAMLNATRQMPRVFISHAHALTHPVETAAHLYGALASCDVRGLRMPSAREISAFMDPTLHRSRPPEKHPPLNDVQRYLCACLQNQSQAPEPLSVSPAAKIALRVGKETI